MSIEQALYTVQPELLPYFTAIEYSMLILAIYLIRRKIMWQRSNSHCNMIQAGVVTQKELHVHTLSLPTWSARD
jgi:hypothetical protein